MPQPVAASLDERGSLAEADADVVGSELNRQLRREPGSTQCGRVEPRNDLTDHRRDFPVLGHGRAQLASEHGDTVQALLESDPPQVPRGVRIVGGRLQRPDLRLRETIERRRRQQEVSDDQLGICFRVRRCEEHAPGGDHLGDSVNRMHLDAEAGDGPLQALPCGFDFGEQIHSASKSGGRWIQEVPNRVTFLTDPNVEIGQPSPCCRVAACPDHTRTQQDQKARRQRYRPSGGALPALQLTLAFMQRHVPLAATPTRPRGRARA